MPLAILLPEYLWQLIALAVRNIIKIFVYHWHGCVNAIIRLSFSSNNLRFFDEKLVIAVVSGTVPYRSIYFNDFETKYSHISLVRSDVRFIFSLSTLS